MRLQERLACTVTTFSWRTRILSRTGHVRVALKSEHSFDGDLHYFLSTVVTCPTKGGCTEEPFVVRSNGTIIKKTVKVSKKITVS